MAPAASRMAPKKIRDTLDLIPEHIKNVSKIRQILMPISNFPFKIILII